MDTYLVRYFSVIRRISAGREEFVFRSSLGPPRLEKGEEIVIAKSAGEYNPPAKKRAEIFRKLRKTAREKQIPYVINLDR